MADEALDNPQDAEALLDGADARPEYPPIGPDAPWSAVWQLPVLLLGLGLFALGIWAVLPTSDPPSMDGLLDSAAMYLEADNLETAIEKLEVAKANHAVATPAQIGRTWALYGDLNFQQLTKQRSPDPVREAETEAIREARQHIITYYRKAEDAGTGYQLTTRQLGRLARTMVPMDRDAEVMAVLERLAGAPAEARYSIVRAMIERKLAAAGGVDHNQLVPLIERFREEVRTETDRAKADEAVVWVTMIESKQWLASDPATAERFIFQHFPRLMARGVDDEALGPLYVLLAHAQRLQEKHDEAEQNYANAERRLPRQHAMQAQVLLGVAQISLRRGTRDQDPEAGMREALELFKRVVEQFPSEPAYVDGLIGRADVESRLGMHGEARDHFARAAKELLRSPQWDPRRKALGGAVLSHAQAAAEQNAFERSLDLLTLLRPLYEPNPPAQLIHRFALTHELIAQQHDDAAHGTLGIQPTTDARRMHNQEAAIHFGKSAEFFWQYAGLVTQTDDQAHGDALWRAARNFDRAQLWDDAIKVYQAFVRGRLDDDRKLHAKHLLGKAYMAAGDFQAAVDLFNELRRDHPKGRWSYESLVPLARGYAAMQQFASARRVLLEATSDHPAITPDSQVYQDALIELGRLYYEAGQDDPAAFVRAIEVLTEAVERFGDGEAGASLRYLLADSNRRSVVTLDAKLRDRRSQRELIALQAERLRRLQESEIYFNQVITELEARDAALLSPLERTYLRNSYFFQADSAFDRGQYEQAIALYDEAAKRWEADPASLVAHVQIVNAYCEMGNYPAAKRANEKALWALERLPDEAFDDPTLPMSRRHWEDWLRWTSQIDLFGTQARAE